MTIIDVEILAPNGSVEPCRISFEQAMPLELHTNSNHFGDMVISADDLFGALIKLRLALEKDGYLLLCNAARKDAYASRMSREMGGGRQVYLLRNGYQAGSEDMVDSLGKATLSQVGTVSEQREWYSIWLRSLKK